MAAHPTPANDRPATGRPLRGPRGGIEPIPHRDSPAVGPDPHGLDRDDDGTGCER
jgi:hypothetical protein